MCGSLDLLSRSPRSDARIREHCLTGRADRRQYSQTTAVTDDGRNQLGGVAGIVVVGFNVSLYELVVGAADALERDPECIRSSGAAMLALSKQRQLRRLQAARPNRLPPCWADKIRVRRCSGIIHNGTTKISLRANVAGSSGLAEQGGFVTVHVPRGAEIQVGATTFVGRSHTEMARLIAFDHGGNFAATRSSTRTRSSSQIPSKNWDEKRFCCAGSTPPARGSTGITSAARKHPTPTRSVEPQPKRQRGAQRPNGSRKLLRPGAMKCEVNAVGAAVQFPLAECE